MTTGIMRKNEINRYEISDSIEFTSGDLIEFFKDGNWVETSIEFSGDDYYLVGYEEIDMDNLKVRTNFK